MKIKILAGMTAMVMTLCIMSCSNVDNQKVNIDFQQLKESYEQVQESMSPDDVQELSKQVSAFEEKYGNNLNKDQEQKLQEIKDYCEGREQFLDKLFDTLK